MYVHLNVPKRGYWSCYEYVTSKSYYLCGHLIIMDNGVTWKTIYNVECKDMKVGYGVD